MQRTTELARRVLVTGASGFVGQGLCRWLLEQGYQVRAAIRTDDDGRTSEQPGRGLCAERVIVKNLSDPSRWAAAMSEMDSIVHLAARVHVMREAAASPLEEFRRINLKATERMARQAAQAGVRRFVYLSTIKVNGERTFGEPFRETDSPEPEDAYAISKWEAEQALAQVSRETGLEVVIVRPPLVYGPGVKGNFLSLLRLVHAGVPLPLASVNNRRSFVALDNLVDLIARCLEHPRAAGEVFLAADQKDLSTPELIRRIAKSMGKAARLFRFPPALLQMASRSVGKMAVYERLCGSLAVDASKANNVLGWVPISSVDEAMDKMARWFVESQRRRSGHRILGPDGK